MALPGGNGEKEKENGRKKYNNKAEGKESKLKRNEPEYIISKSPKIGNAGRTIDKSITNVHS